MEDATAEIEEGRAVPDSDSLRLKLVGLAIAGTALSAASAAIALSNPSSADRATVAVASVMLTAIPVGVGIYAWGREPRNRFGGLLVATGFLWGLTSLSASEQRRHLQRRQGLALGRRGGDALHDARLPDGSAEKAGGAGCRAGHLPAGRLLYLPTAFVSEQYVLPFPLTTCTADCPTNAFMLTGSEPAFLGEIEYLRDVLAVLLFTAAVSILALRIKRATPLMRPMLVPVLAIAIVRLVAVAVYQLAASNYPGSAFTEVVGWMAAFGIPAMSIAFLVGLIYWRMVEARMLEQVTAGLRSDLGPEGLESLSPVRGWAGRSGSSTGSCPCGGSDSGRMASGWRPNCPHQARHSSSPNTGRARTGLRWSTRRCSRGRRSSSKRSPPARSPRSRTSGSPPRWTRPCRRWRNRAPEFPRLPTRSAGG